VLTQKHGGQHQPVAFLSKFLDPVTWGCPEYLQARVAIVLLTKESRKITFGGSLVISTPHQVRMILSQKVGSRILKYETILLGKDDLTLNYWQGPKSSHFLGRGRKEEPCT
jgi:hypothetical protein